MVFGTVASPNLPARQGHLLRHGTLNATQLIGGSGLRAIGALRPFMVPIPVLAPQALTDDPVALIDPKGIGIGSTTMPRSLPVGRIVRENQDGSARSRLVIDKLLDSMDVFHDVVGADV